MTSISLIRFSTSALGEPLKETEHVHGPRTSAQLSVTTWRDFEKLFASESGNGSIGDAGFIAFEVFNRSEKASTIGLLAKLLGTPPEHPPKKGRGTVQ